MAGQMNRRDLVKGSLGATAGLWAGLSYEHRSLAAQLVDRAKYDRVQEPVTGLQKAALCGRQVSRLIIGGNLISGSAHAGELLYQSALMTRYFCPEKILETWQIAEENGIILPKIRVGVRSGDTSSYEKQKMVRKAPHILITTPETLSIVLSTTKFRDNLREVRYVIVDEIHEMCSSKRGVHLSVSLERLQYLVTSSAGEEAEGPDGSEFTRIGRPASS